MHRRLVTCLAFTALASLAFAGLVWLVPARAQERPVHIIFPFAAGGSGDATARLIADKMRLDLNSPVIVENVTGGAGRVGVMAVKKSTPDGTTLLLTPIAPVAVYQHSYKSLDYDPINDFQPVVESRCGAVAVGRTYLLSAPFVWRCLSGSTLTPFPHSAHRTGHADFPHPALGQDFTPSPTARRAQAGTGVRARSARKGARVDKSRPYCA